MMIRKFTTTLPALLAVFTLLSGASASPLPPGASLFPPDTNPVPPGSVLLASDVSTFAGVNTKLVTKYTGTLYQAVYRNAAGFLDFYYQIRNNATSANPITRLTVSDFTSVLIPDAGYILPPNANPPGGPFVAGTKPPITMDRSTAGDTVGFNFGPLGAANLTPGSTSYVLYVDTTATKFDFLGTASVIDSVVTSKPAFEPVLPEFASVAGFGSLLGMGGLSFMLRIRSRRRRPEA